MEFIPHWFWFGTYEYRQSRFGDFALELNYEWFHFILDSIVASNKLFGLIRGNL